ncbi:hypothetical protein V8C42DRAFT_195664 [Trichoderma barbatum]
MHSTEYQEQQSRKHDPRHGSRGLCACYRTGSIKYYEQILPVNICTEHSWGLVSCPHVCRHCERLLRHIIFGTKYRHAPANMQLLHALLIYGYVEAIAVPLDQFGDQQRFDWVWLLRKRSPVAYQTIWFWTIYLRVKNVRAEDGMTPSLAAIRPVEILRMHKRVVIVGSQPMVDPPILLLLPFEACSRVQGKQKRQGNGPAL